MNLSTTTKEALELWYSPSTWNSNNIKNMNDWYNFIYIYSKEQGFSVDQSALKEFILSKKRSGKANKDYFNQIIETRISLMVDILEFLRFLEKKQPNEA